LVYICIAYVDLLWMVKYESVSVPWTKI